MFWDIIGWVLIALGGLTLVALVILAVIIVIISSSHDNLFR